MSARATQRRLTSQRRLRHNQPMKSVEEASAEILAAFEPVGLERVPLLAALGRFAASDVYARSPLPSFDQSAMDGYAVRASELSAARTCPLRT